MLWLEILLVLLTALAGARVAARLGRFWVWGIFLPSFLLVLIFLAHRIAWLPVYFPFSLLTHVNVEPPLMACAIVVLFTTVISRLQRERTRTLAAALTAVLVAYHAVMPLAIPLVLQPAFARMVTRMDNSGVCLQTQRYSCGPAAAVTSLRALGVPADEGDLAIESRCQPPLGVDASSLASAIQHLYGDDGITAQCLWVGSIEDLPVYSIASLQALGMQGHAVAVLGVTRNWVIVGDPAGGITRLSRQTFMRLWTGVAVVLQRDPVH